jgi:hypothetical protein
VKLPLTVWLSVTEGLPEPLAEELVDAERLPLLETVTLCDPDEEVEAETLGEPDREVVSEPVTLTVAESENEAELDCDEDRVPDMVKLPEPEKDPEPDVDMEPEEEPLGVPDGDAEVVKLPLNVWLRVPEGQPEPLAEELVEADGQPLLAPDDEPLTVTEGDPEGVKLPLTDWLRVTEGQPEPLAEELVDTERLPLLETVTLCDPDEEVEVEILGEADKDVVNEPVTLAVAESENEAELDCNEDSVPDIVKLLEPETDPEPDEDT